MKTIIKNKIALLFFNTFFIFTFCNCVDNNDPGTTENNGIFKCKINGVPFSATFITTSSTSGIISAKGIKATNGTNYTSGNIRISLYFGTNQSGTLGTGNHTVVARLETANQPNNMNKVEINDLIINDLAAYVRGGTGTVNVEKYYESTYWQGAKGTFNNIKIDTFTAAPAYIQDSVVLTDGEFDFKYVY